MTRQPHDFLTDSATFQYRRVCTADVPVADDRIVDVALLDMNHDWPNLGHDSIVQALRESADRLQPFLSANDLVVRVLSFDVRQSLCLPEASNRFLLFVGTGGPGHLDPRMNDGVFEGSQGIKEDPSWEPRLFALFDWIARNEDAALIAICHSFGLVCRWSGIARAELRGERKGGKSSGIVPNVLVDDGVKHPWFKRLASELPDGRTFSVLDNRLYDLVPQAALPAHAALAYENDDGDALTIVELARDRSGEMPRILGMNHHPEIIDRAHLRRVLDEKLERGEVTEQWYRERDDVFRTLVADGERERAMRLTSRYTWIEPLDFHLQRIVRDRAGVTA